MRIPILLLLFLGLIVTTGSAHAQSILSDVPAVPSEGSQKPPLKERLRGAQDQFLQHQNQVKERVSEFKDTAATRVQDIKTESMERREAVNNTVSERRIENKENALEQRTLRETRFEERKVQLMEKRTALASSTEERRERFAAKIGEQAASRFDHAVQLLNAMILRLSGIADRIDTRIDTLAADGVEVSRAEEELAKARAEIDEAEAAVTSLSDALSDALASETPRESLQATRTLAESAKIAIRSAHEALRNAAGVLPKLNTGAGI